MPASVRKPPPILVSPPAPESVEASVTLLPLVSKVAPPAPKGASLPEMSVDVPEAHCRPPPSRVIEPEPKLAAELKLMKPPLIVVPPEYVMAPASVSVPAPVLLSDHLLPAAPPMPAWWAITWEKVCDWPLAGEKVIVPLPFRNRPEPNAEPLPLALPPMKPAPPAPAVTELPLIVSVPANVRLPPDC